MTVDSTPTEDDPHLPLLARRPYRFFLGGRFLGTLATGAESVVIGWEVYKVARRSMPVERASLAIGLVGLAQFLPLFVLTLIAGETADRYDRRKILALCYVAHFLVSAGLAVQSALGGGLLPIFALSAVFGCARAFFQPTASALGPNLVPLRLLPRAIATNSFVLQFGRVLGPALGGLLCAVSPLLGYATSAALYAAAALGILQVRVAPRPVLPPDRSRVAQIREGLAYVWGNKLVLGAVSLDLFAVLLGGATGLLPVFARDVLHVGPVGNGALRAASAIGAVIVAGWLAWRPIRSKAGPRMFAAVALFGAMTLVFAFSRSMPLSLLALAVLGGADMVSVFTRQSLVQIATPDSMRGRVSAVSTLFVGASNELGEFESGLVSRLLGPVRAVAFGGAASLGITALWSYLFPSLRKADRLV